MKFLIHLLLFLASTIILSAQNNRKTLIIGIDGVRGDAAIAANTPNMDALAANGITSYEAQTLPVTYSGPGWSTILTGVWMDKHGVRDNVFIPNNLIEYPHFFQYVKSANPDLYTASIVHWSPINILIAPLTQTDALETYDSDAAVRDACINLLNNEDPDITFIHLDDVDHAGHSSGFSPSNLEYLEAIETIDNHVGQIMTALENRPNYSNEEWLIILCTDHGGIGTGHGCNEAACQDIFYVASSNLINNEVIEKTIVDINMTNIINLDGNDSYIEIADAPQHNFNEKNFTVEIKLKTNGWSSDAPIISNKDWDSGFNSGFIIAGNTNGSSWKFNMGDGLLTRMDIEGGTINDNAWHHIAVSVDRTGASFTWQDGYIQEFNTSGFILDSDSNFPLIIGQDGTTNYPSSFNGLISEIRIWDTNLRNITLNEWNCKNIDVSHPNYSNLVGLWKLDEGTGTLINDLSSYSQNGTLMNNASWEIDNTIYSCSDYTQVPHNTDIVPTVLDFMCIDIDENWSFDGTSAAEGINCISTSIHEVLSKDVHIYPTISKDEISYEIGDLQTNMSIQLYNTRGQLITNQSITNNRGAINIGHYTSGIYFIVISNKENGLFYREKIIKL